MTVTRKYDRFCLALTTIVGAISFSAGSREYEFDQYLVDFNKEYSTEDEYQRREELYKDTMAKVEQHNADGSSRSYKLGVNKFADMEAHELKSSLGYDKSLHPGWLGQEELMLNSQDLNTEMIQRQLRTTTAASASTKSLPFTIDEPSSLPSSIDWRNHIPSIVTPVKSQGNCGSCWAFASTAVLESHIALQTGTLFELSTQELVSCAPNLRHCGGGGGCTGSTAQLAYHFVAQQGHGVLMEDQFGYRSFDGTHANCTIYEKDDTNNHDTQKIKGAVATIKGYVTLPANNYTVLLNAVAKAGPVAVAVAASPWSLYESGVFDDEEATKKDPISAANVNHLVVLMGYGTDEETGLDYWLVRNSWGPLWGEQGYIRLKRVDPAETDDDDGCGMDTTPSDGLACTKDKTGQHDIPVKPVKVCGTSGILFDAVLPLGGELLVN